MKNVFLFLIMATLASCATPARDLGRAKKLVDRAIRNGAIVSRDTTWNNIHFHVKGLTFQTKLPDPHRGQTVRYITKDSLILELRRIPGPPGKRDTIEVAGKCPDVDVSKRVPTAIDTEIKAGFTVLQLILWIILALAVGYFARIAHVFIARKLDTKENSV